MKLSFSLLGFLLIGLISTEAPAGDGGLPPEDVAIYRQAFERVEAGDYAGARALAARGSSPLLAKVIAWLDLTREHGPVDFAEVYAFLVVNPHWPNQHALQLRVESVLPATLPIVELLAWFHVHPPVSTEGAVRYATTLLRAGQEERAIDLIRQTWVQGYFVLAEERRFRARFSRYLRPEDQIARLDRLLWSRQATAARRQARHMTEGHRALAEARLRLAAMQPGVDAAIQRVPELLRDDPGLVFERTLWRRRNDLDVEVVELLGRQDAAFEPESWWKIRSWAARRALLKGDPALAYRIAAAHGLTSGLGFAQGEWFAGWTALRFLGDHKAAYRHFARLYEGVSTPVSRARGAYWAGRTAEASGEQARAAAWYEVAAEHSTTYYGQLAADRLDSGLALPQEAPALLDAAERRAFEENELVRVARLLAQVGQRNLLDRFIGRLLKTMRSPGELRTLAALARNVGRPDLALEVARAARERGALIIPELYPVYPMLLSDGIEPALLLSIIRQESGFNPVAVSGSGARGLMQLMPATAEMVAGKLALPYSRSLLMDDPKYNLRLGQAYLLHLQERFPGSDLLALAAYNAGPGSVERWIQEFGDPRDDGVDPIDWIETIPFEETRNYVQRVLESATVYRHILTQSEAGLGFSWPDPSSNAKES